MKIKRIALSVLALGIITASSWAATYNVSATSDTFVYSPYNGNYYGLGSYVSVTDKKTGFFRFDTANAKTHFDNRYGANNWRITDIKFIGYSLEQQTFSDAKAGNFAFYYDGTTVWHESQTSYNNPRFNTSWLAGLW